MYYLYIKIVRLRVLKDYEQKENYAVRMFDTSSSKIEMEGDGSPNLSLVSLNTKNEEKEKLMALSVEWKGYKKM